MATPAIAEARIFYRAAGERMQDARLILERADRTTAAAYLDVPTTILGSWKNTERLAVHTCPARSTNFSHA